jgi:hypothetical protein
MLGAAQLRPAALPPSAIVCIRDLRDPLPGTLPVQPGGLRPPLAWEQAAAAAIDALIRRAARPAQGRLPSNTDAVLFADEGELLACLALDLSQGQAGGRWWWQAILRALPLSAADRLHVLLCRQARYVPAALRHLAEWGQAAAVVAALAPEEAMLALSALCEAYDMVDLRLHLAQAPASSARPNQPSKYPVGDSAPPASRPGHSAAEDAAGAPDTGDRARPDWPAPWERWLPAGLIPRGLSKERACLLGVGLTLYEVPAIVRTSSFLRALRAWWTTAATPAEHDDLGAAARQQRGTAREVVGVTRAAPAPHVSPAASSPPTDPGPGGGRLSLELKRDAAADLHPVRAGRADHRVETPHPEPQEQPPAELNEATAWVLEDSVPTQLGGVLYLINLMARLDLPACFEADWGLASQVGAWGILEVLGRALLEHNAERWRADLLWTALADLDGRASDSLPGQSFRGSHSLHLPTGWPVPAFDDAVHDRLASPLLEGLNPDLIRWLALALPTIRWLLGQALSPAAPQALDLERTLLLHPGRLYVTSTHVDLVMRLDDISLPVRLAGLDRDPGWLPDFGRVVAFHFK